MYNHTTIINCLAGLIGFESSYNADHPDIDQDLLVSDSGVYVNSALHPLLTYDNIQAVVEQFSRVNVRIHSTAATYKIGDIVNSSGVIYQSIQNGNLNHDPAEANSLWWVKTNLLSAYLRRLYSGSVMKLFSQLFTEKKLNEVAKTLLANVSLFEGVGRITDRITKTGKMAGYRIRLNHPDTVAVLNYIGLQLDTVQAALPIYLYHSSSNVPVKTFTINHTKSIQFEWHKIAGEILSFLSDSVNAGGSYALVYYEDELSGSAIKKDISFNGKNLCGSCSEHVVNSNLYNKWSRFVSIQPFYINASDIPRDGSGNIVHQMWDETREIYQDDVTWGINIQMTVQCDVSALICQSRNILTNALAQQLKVDLLNEMTFSLRDNQKREKVAGLAAVALDNQENGQYGEVKKLTKAIQALSFDYSRMSDACLPCGSNAKPKLKSVWG
jgi:hypothetical protein